MILEYLVFSSPEAGFIPVILGIFTLNATMKDLCLKCLMQQQLLLRNVNATSKWSLCSPRRFCSYSECTEMEFVVLC